MNSYGLFRYLKLNRFTRGSGREKVALKRVCDAVVNFMLMADNFYLPEDTIQIADADGFSVEGLYKVIAKLNSALGSMIIFSFDKGEEASTQTCKDDDVAMMLEETGKFTVSGEVFVSVPEER